MSKRSIGRWNQVTNSFLTVFCAAMIGFTLVPKAKADVWDQSTIVSFSNPVEIPGKVLPAGTYMIKLLNEPADRNIVQIFDRDGTKLYATLRAVPEYRRVPTDGTTIGFEERAANAPEAIHDWFYPGDQYGHELIYSKHPSSSVSRSVEHGRRDADGHSH